MYGTGYLWWLMLSVSLTKPWCQVVWANISLNTVKVIFLCDKHLNLVDSVKEIILQKVGGTYYEKTCRLRFHKEEGNLPWDCLQTQDQNISSCQNFQDACLSACFPSCTGFYDYLWGTLPWGCTLAFVVVALPVHLLVSASVCTHMFLQEVDTHQKCVF